ncbi:MAG: hypothetical protein DMF91_06375 [Acidobacteria bacterium]|nr:MAG: hypothetical protein DMF91_06375 [Acidobacteriota bacterium]
MLASGFVLIRWRRSALMPARSLIAVALLGLLCTADAVGQARRVQVGYCSTLKNIDAAKAAGFDYLELGTSEITALSDDEYEKAVTHINQVGLPVPVTNLFLPAALVSCPTAGDGLGVGAGG